MTTVPQKNKETLSIRTLGTLESTSYKMSFVMVFQKRKALGAFSQVNSRRRGCCLCWWPPAALADSARLVQEGTAETKALWNVSTGRDTTSCERTLSGPLDGFQIRLTRLWAADSGGLKGPKILIYAGLVQVHDGLIFRILFWPNFTRKVQNSSVLLQRSLLKQNVHSFNLYICFRVMVRQYNDSHTRTHTHCHTSVQFRVCNTATCIYLEQQHNGRTCKLDTCTVGASWDLNSQPPTSTKRKQDSITKMFVQLKTWLFSSKNKFREIKSLLNV